MDQAQLGKLLGLSGRTISNIESDRRPLRHEEIAILHRQFLVLPDDLECTKGTLVNIVVSKRFERIDEVTMAEITKHIEAIRNLGGDWEVSCRLW